MYRCLLQQINTYYVKWRIPDCPTIISGMYPILGRIGPYLLYSYTAVLALAILLTFGWLTWQQRQGRLTPGWVDGLLLTLTAALIAGRAGFVISEWAYYASHRRDIWRIAQGGLNGYTALLAGMAILWIWCRWQKRPFLPLADHLAPMLLLGAALTWFAHWLHGSAYGSETTLGWLATDLPDTFGIFAVRYRTQLIGALLALLGLPLLNVARRLPTGSRFWLAICWLHLSRLPADALRGDPTTLWFGLRYHLIADGLLAATALLAILLLQYLHHKIAAAPTN